MGFLHEGKHLMGFSGGSVGKESACSVGDLDLIVGLEDPLEKERIPSVVLLPGKFYGQKSLAGYSPWGHKSWT